MACLKIKQSRLTSLLCLLLQLQKRDFLIVIFVYIHHSIAYKFKHWIMLHNGIKGHNYSCEHIDMLKYFDQQYSNQLQPWHG